MRKVIAYASTVALVALALLFNYVSGAEFVDFLKVAFCALVAGNGAEHLAGMKR